MSELSEAVKIGVYDALFSTVGLNGLTGVYEEKAPIEAVYPFVTFTRAPGTVTRSFGETLQGERDIWFIKSFTDAEKANGESTSPQKLNARILTIAETRLVENLSIDGGRIERNIRVGDIPQQIEVISDRDVYSSGFQFEIYVAPN